MTKTSQVDKMGTSQKIKTEQVKRKTPLSPELTEVLHMLKSLENEFSHKDAAAR